MADVIEECWNWKGELAGYKRIQGDAVTFVPIAPGNTDYQRIIDGIAAGELATKPPALAWACPTCSIDGTQTGYDTDLGFVPCSKGNRLFARLLTAIDDGTCEVKTREQQPAVAPTDYVEHLIVCVFLDQAWPHVTENYQGALRLRPSRTTAVKQFTFCLRNLSDSEGKGALLLLLEKHGCRFDIPPTLNKPIQTGVLEIEVPVEDLRKILRGELTDDTNPQSGFLHDIVAQALARSGRKKEAGPPVDWLVAYANLYLQSFVSDFSNRVVEAFWNEYGGAPVGHVSPFSLQRHFLILHKTKAGSVSLGTFSSAGSKSFGLQGQWQHSVGHDLVSDDPHQPHHPVRRALSRLRMLTETGFHMEAVVLTNSILEVAVASALAASVAGHADLQREVKQLGHGVRLSLLDELTSVGAIDQKHTDERKTLVSDIRQIYRHRNDYVHELTMPGEVPFLDFRSQRNMYNLVRRFSDAFEQQHWLWWMDMLAAGGTEIIDAVLSFLAAQQQPDCTSEDGTL